MIHSNTQMLLHSSSRCQIRTNVGSQWWLVWLWCLPFACEELPRLQLESAWSWLHRYLSTFPSRSKRADGRNYWDSLNSFGIMLSLDLSAIDGEL